MTNQNYCIATNIVLENSEMLNNIWMILLRQNKID